MSVPSFADSWRSAKATETAAADLDPQDFRARQTRRGVSLSWGAPTGKINGFTAIVTLLRAGYSPLTTNYVDSSASEDGTHIYRVDALDENSAVVGRSDEVRVKVGSITQPQPQPDSSTAKPSPIAWRPETATPTQTPSPTATDRPTVTQTPSPTASGRPTVTATKTLSATPSDTPTATATPSPTASETAGPTATQNPCALVDFFRAANTDRAAGSCPAGSVADTFTLMGDLVLSEALPTVTSDVTIIGAGCSICGNDAQQIFYVDWGVNLTLENITLTKGKASFGGAIYNQGILTIRQSTIHDNEADLFGGALNSTYGHLTVERSSFTNNTALSGAAIYSGDLEASISNSTISGNTDTMQVGAIQWTCRAPAPRPAPEPTTTARPRLPSASLIR